PRSGATRGMIVSTARASAAMKVVVSTSPVVRARRCGAQRPLGGGAAAPTCAWVGALIADTIGASDDPHGVAQRRSRRARQAPHELGRVARHARTRHYEVEPGALGALARARVHV